MLTVSLQWSKTLPKNILVMTQKQSEGGASVILELGEHRVPLHYHRSQVHSGQVAPDRVLSMGQIELFDI